MYEPTFWIDCAASLDVLGITQTREVGHIPDGEIETELNYTVTTYSNQDLSVVCIVTLAPSRRGTNSAYYPNTTDGARSGPCVAMDDYEPSIGIVQGLWQFEISSNLPTVTYKDADNPYMLEGFSHQFTADECQVLMLDDDGGWAEKELREAFGGK